MTTARSRGSGAWRAATAAGQLAWIAAPALIATLAGLAGCTLITDSFLTNNFSGDPFPVEVDTSSGAIMVGMHQGGQPDRSAVIELLSPLTVSDTCPGSAPSAPLCEAVPPSLVPVDLTLLGAPGPTAAAPGPIDLASAVPRARFPQVQLVSLHPCMCDRGDPTCDPEQCFVGTPGAPRPFRGVIGADALAGDAVRLRLGDNQIFVLPDIGGSDRGLSLSCDAVFDAPYRGGGTLVVAGTELPFGNLRVAVQACVGQGPDPDPDPAIRDGFGQGRSVLAATFDPAVFRQQGADMLFVVSTSIGISILGEAAYERYRLAIHDAPRAPDVPAVDPPELAALPADAVYLPSGLIRGRRGQVDRLALVAAPTSNALSPCRQVYAHRLLTTYQLDDDDRADSTIATCKTDGGNPHKVDCPCKDGSLFCPVPAILELSPPALIDVLVVADTDPMLQALRAELRPDQPEVDGILGTNVLRGAEIDVDYPHDRLVARCRGGNCTARPQLAESGDVCQIKRCFTGTADHHGCPTSDPATRPLSVALPAPILPN